MSAKEFCIANSPFAQYSAGSTESIIKIHGFEYGVSDYAYVSYSCGATCTYHKLKIYHTASHGFYILLHAQRIYLEDCTRIM